MQKTTIACLSLAFAALISTKSHAQQVTVVNQQPPPPKVEVVGNPPEPGEHWIPGYWTWENNTWVWVAGMWSQPPYPRAFWEPHYWGWRPFGWVYRPGRWVF